MEPRARDRFGAAGVARLATVTPDGDPHLVPVVFALASTAAGDVVWLAVDSKAKSGRPLQRLANIAAHPRVSLLVDHYEDDWAALWWVRADGLATVAADESEESGAALAALVAKYPQYAAQPPPGPFLRVDVTRWSSWEAR